MVYEVLKPIPAHFNPAKLAVGDVFKYANSYDISGMRLEFMDGRETVVIDLELLRTYIQQDYVGPANPTAQVLYA